MFYLWRRKNEDKGKTLEKRIRIFRVKFQRVAKIITKGDCLKFRSDESLKQFHGKTLEEPKKFESLEQCF